jgi:hypothetical protein
MLWRGLFDWSFPELCIISRLRGNARQEIVWNDDERKLFLAILAHVVKRFGWISHAYAKFRVSRLVSSQAEKAWNFERMILENPFPAPC